MKLYIRPKTKGKSEKLDFEDGYIYLYISYELRYWWKFWTWLREPFKYMDVEVILWDKEFISEDEAFAIYENQVKKNIDTSAMKYIRIFTPSQFVSGQFYLRTP